MNRALLQSAQALAARGWLVFPCAPDGKRPALRGNWQDLATADHAQIQSWWARAPYNIGIACGPSGMVVIDLDVCHESLRGDAVGNPEMASGAATLTALCAQYGEPYPPPTYRVSTPSGGCHLYYAAPDVEVRNSAGRLGRHVDVRARGGYVIGDASSIDGRTYTAWDQRPPVPLPAWIGSLLRSSPAAPEACDMPRALDSARGTAYAMAALREETRLVATARPGTRNDTLNRAAFSLGQLTAAGFLPPLAVVSALASAAEQSGLAQDESQRTIRSGMAAGGRHPRKVL